MFVSLTSAVALLRLINKKPADVKPGLRNIVLPGLALVFWLQPDERGRHWELINI